MAASAVNCKQSMTSTPHVELGPFRIENTPLLWAWLQEFDYFNFDSSGPKSPRELAEQISQRIAAGERVYQVTVDDVPVGAIGLATFGDIVAFRGICFAKKVHGSGIPLRMVAQVLDHAFSRGFSKVMASYFSDNMRVGNFLEKIGAVRTTIAAPTTTRSGFDEWYWQNVEITPNDFYAKHGTRATHSDASSGLQVPT